MFFAMRNSTHKRIHNLNQINQSKTSQHAILKQKTDKKISIQLTKEEIFCSLTSLCVWHLASLS